MCTMSNTIKIDTLKLLKTSFYFGKKHYGRIFAYYLIATCPIYISTLYVVFNGYRQFSHGLILLFSLFLNILISFLLAPFVIFPVAKSVANVQMTFNGKRYLLSTFLYFLIIFIGTLLLIIPGIYLFILFCFVPLVALIEDREDKQNAFKVSAYLIKGNFWKIIILGFVIYTLLRVCDVFYTCLVLPFDGSVYFGVLSLLLACLLFPVFMPIHTILYYRFKADKEGVSFFEKYTLDIDRDNGNFARKPIGTLIILLISIFIIVLPFRVIYKKTFSTTYFYETLRTHVQHMQPTMKFINHQSITLPLGWIFQQAVLDYCLKDMDHNIKVHVKMDKNNDQNKNIQKNILKLNPRVELQNKINKIATVNGITWDVYIFGITAKRKRQNNTFVVFARQRGDYNLSVYYIVKDKIQKKDEKKIIELLNYFGAYLR